MDNTEKMVKIRGLFNQAVELGNTIDLDKFKSEGGVGYIDSTLIMALKQIKIHDDTKWHDRFKK